ncbi:hypothetical protein BGZ60DRAFT_528662 [Tricladium varicosporioides]|nr:hypothetical protein BGZ60DRAFT_528662 [Hymenoscyphus varicosporioides]
MSENADNKWRRYYIEELKISVLIDGAKEDFKDVLADTESLIVISDFLQSLRKGQKGLKTRGDMKSREDNEQVVARYNDIGTVLLQRPSHVPNPSTTAKDSTEHFTINIFPTHQTMTEATKNIGKVHLYEKDAMRNGGYCCYFVTDVAKRIGPG